MPQVLSPFCLSPLRGRACNVIAESGRLDKTVPLKEVYPSCPVLTHRA